MKYTISNELREFISRGYEALERDEKKRVNIFVGGGS